MKLRAVILFLAALAAAGGTARLGQWQLSRAAQKNEMQAELLRQRALPPLALGELPRSAAEVAAVQQRAVVLNGRWQAPATVYLENRVMSGRTGFLAVTPLWLDDGSAVLVQRGWLPRDQMDRTRITAPPPPAGPVQLHGRIAPALSRLFEFEAAASGVIRQNLDLQAYARETGLPLRPFAVVQEDGPPGSPAPQDGLLRDWALPAADVQKHYGYAFQWFALCTLVIGLYAWFQLIRPRRPGRA